MGKELESEPVLTEEEAFLAREGEGSTTPSAEAAATPRSGQKYWPVLKPRKEGSPLPTAAF